MIRVYLAMLIVPINVHVPCSTMHTHDSDTTISEIGVTLYGQKIYSVDLLHVFPVFYYRKHPTHMRCTEFCYGIGVVVVLESLVALVGLQ